MEDLPQLKEFQVVGEEIGEPSSLEEVVSYDSPATHNGENHLLSAGDESE